MCFLILVAARGGVLLSACRYPFKKVIGVDVSEKLNQIAKANLDKLSLKHVCKQYELVTVDAKYYEIPGDVSHIYLFNPFGFEVLECVFESIKRSIKNCPRKVTLIYYNPKHSDKLESKFEIKKNSELIFNHFGLYRSKFIIYEIC